MPQKLILEKLTCMSPHVREEIVPRHGLVGNTQEEKAVGIWLTQLTIEWN